MCAARVELDPRLDELLPLLFDAAVSPEAWPAFLAALARHTNAITPGVMLVDRATQRSILSADCGLDPAFGRRYEEYYWHRDVRRRELQKQPAGTVVAGHELVPDSLLVRTEFYNDFLRPLGLFHVALAIPFKDAKLQGMMRIARAPGEQPFGESELALLDALQPYLRRALEMHVALSEARTRSAVANAMLEQVRLAAFSVEPSGRAVPANEAGEQLLALRDGLAIEAGRLRVCDRVTQMRLDRMLDNALAGVPGDGCLRIGRPSGRLALALRVTPLLANAGSVGASPRAAALVFAEETDVAPQLDVDSVRSLYDFSDDEAQLAVRLAAGHTLPQIARGLGVSVDAVRAQRAVVFRRLRVHTRAGLAARLVGAQGAVARPPVRSASSS